MGSNQPMAGDGAEWASRSLQNPNILCFCDSKISDDAVSLLQIISHQGLIHIKEGIAQVER